MSSPDVPAELSTPSAAPQKTTHTRKPRKISTEKRSRKTKPFPVDSFADCFSFAAEIFKLGSGQKVRRLTVFDALKKSPDSGPSRLLITSANKYGLIEGGYQAEFFELTAAGKIAVDPDSNPVDVLRTKFALAIQGIEPFRTLYEMFKGNKLPSIAVLKDNCKGVEPDDLEECVEQFIINLKALSLLRTISGAERVLTIEHALDEVPRSTKGSGLMVVGTPTAPARPGEIAVKEDLSNVCFYITPIGDDGSEQRKHADLFLGSIVESALVPLSLKVIRADQIGKPGLISSQIIDYLLRARLVIADLSFHNPNVFYELAIRHACRLPTVQIIRVGDRIPFDLAQFRTIKIDNTDIYTLIPRLETYRAEIASQARKALEDPESGDNPIAAFAPQLKVVVSDGASKPVA